MSPKTVGVLMQTHQFTPQTAGLAATAFLLAVALALSPLFTRRALATLGYTLAAGCFYLASTLSGGGELLGIFAVGFLGLMPHAR